MSDPSDNDDKNEFASKATPMEGGSMGDGQTQSDEGSTTGDPIRSKIVPDRKRFMNDTIANLLKFDPSFKPDFTKARDGLKSFDFRETGTYNNGLSKVTLSLTVGPVEPSRSESHVDLPASSESQSGRNPVAPLVGEVTSASPEEKPPRWLESNWQPLAGLSFTSIAVLLLIVLLVRPGLVPPKLPDLPDIAGPITKEIHDESAKVSGVIAAQSDKVARIEQAMKRLETSGIKDAQQFASDVAKQVVVPREIGAADLLSYRLALEKLESEVKAARSKAESPPPLPPEYWARLGTELKNAAGSATPKATSPTARDTYVVITHGAAMNANRFISTLREAMSKFTSRGRDATVRVGLAVASTTELTTFVSPADPQVDLKAFNTPSPDASEAPQLFGRSLKQLFAADRLTQRSILLVTDQAMAPAVDNPEDMEGWNALSQVDVLVLTTRDLKEFKLEDWKKYARWCSFAESRRGSVQLIAHPADERRQNDLLRESLRRLILQAD